MRVLIPQRLSCRRTPREAVRRPRPEVMSRRLTGATLHDPALRVRRSADPEGDVRTLLRLMGEGAGGTPERR